MSRHNPGRPSRRQFQSSSRPSAAPRDEYTTRSGRSVPMGAAGLMTGVLRMARNGAGFLLDPAGKAIWVEAEDLGVSLPGDTVTVRLSTSRGETKGVVVKVVARSPRDIVGTLKSIGRFCCVVPLNPVYHRDFYVPDTHGAKLDDRVVVRFTHWENKHVAPEGEIVDVIGPAAEPSLDTLVVMKQYDLPEEFPPEVVSAAEQVSESLARPERRLDIRDKFILTCDPATAKDFDDAISFELDGEGRRVLGVHIADVSHFVTPGSVLDDEARKRSTSVYLVDKVVPMLPEQLSNGVCSLVPNEDRFSFSAFMTFDKAGHMVARRFAKTLMRSHLRLDYEQALAILHGGTPADLPDCPAEARRILRETNALAQQLRKNRFAAGALDLEVPEVEITLDANSEMTGLAVRPYDESHQLIEEAMVAANEAVATELWTRGIHILARLHEAPDPEKLEELRQNLQLLGIRTGDLTRGGALAALMRSLRGNPLEGTLSTMILRSMKRAVYSATKIGHFGLSKAYYAHFTSPIRRYPDLTLHRQLASFLDGHGGREKQDYLDSTAAWASEREQVADDAERALVEIKKFRFLEKQVATRDLVDYEAVIGKVTSYGLFIDIPQIACGGMIHISNLADEFVRYDAFDETLHAGRQSWKVGDKIHVHVASVDFDARRADFVPAELGGRPNLRGDRRPATNRGTRPQPRPAGETARPQPRMDKGPGRGRPGSAPRRSGGGQAAGPRPDARKFGRKGGNGGFGGGKRPGGSRRHGRH